MNSSVHTKITEKTKISIPLAVAIFIIGTIITVSAGFTDWKAGQEAEMKSLKSSVDDLYKTTDELKAADKAILNTQEKDRKTTLEVQKDLVEIKTDIKWLRSFFDRSSEGE